MKELFESSYISMMSDINAELRKEIENLQQELQRKDNIINELKELILNDINFSELCDRDKIEDKFKELEKEINND